MKAATPRPRWNRMISRWTFLCAREAKDPWKTHRVLVLRFVAAVFQLVVTGVERQRLHDVRSGAEKLAM
jgi:hypothetical protein